VSPGIALLMQRLCQGICQTTECMYKQTSGPCIEPSLHLRGRQADVRILATLEVVFTKWFKRLHDHLTILEIVKVAQLSFLPHQWAHITPIHLCHPAP
jgi:hypothetical protein